ncbi:MAG: hypothetical protein AB1490_05430 [Pseudomonadota bacterium]
MREPSRGHLKLLAHGDDVAGEPIGPFAFTAERLFAGGSRVAGLAAFGVEASLGRFEIRARGSKLTIERVAPLLFAIAGLLHDGRAVASFAFNFGGLTALCLRSITLLARGSDLACQRFGSFPLAAERLLRRSRALTRFAFGIGGLTALRVRCTKFVAHGGELTRQLILLVLPALERLVARCGCADLGRGHLGEPDIEVLNLLARSGKFARLCLSLCLSLCLGRSWIVGSRAGAGCVRLRGLLFRIARCSGVRLAARQTCGACEAIFGCPDMVNCGDVVSIQLGNVARLTIGQALQNLLPILDRANAIEMLRRHPVHDAIGASPQAGRQVSIVVGLRDLGQIIRREELPVTATDPEETTDEIPPIACGFGRGRSGRFCIVRAAPGSVRARAARTAALLCNPLTAHNENNENDGPSQCERDATPRELARAPASEFLRHCTTSHHGAPCSRGSRAGEP